MKVSGFQSTRVDVVRLITKNVQNLNADFYKDIVSGYLDYTLSLDFSNSFILADLLRHSLCVVLGLESSSSCVLVEDRVKDCVEAIKGYVPETYIRNATKVQKEALLEACVHCIEMSIEKAGV